MRPDRRLRGRLRAADDEIGEATPRQVGGTLKERLLLWRDASFQSLALAGAGGRTHSRVHRGVRRRRIVTPEMVRQIAVPSQRSDPGLESCRAPLACAAYASTLVFAKLGPGAEMQPGGQSE